MVGLGGGVVMIVTFNPAVEGLDRLDVSIWIAV